MLGIPSPSKSQTIEGLNGNLCRCCGYVNILKAVQLAARLRFRA
ncbi:MAG: 2Fe-2S iron-sulfur cluster-binding protein [Verrucomicrobiota bacterium]